MQGRAPAASAHKMPLEKLYEYLRQHASGTLAPLSQRQMVFETGRHQDIIGRSGRSIVDLATGYRHSTGSEKNPTRRLSAKVRHLQQHHWYSRPLHPHPAVSSVPSGCRRSPEANFLSAKLRVPFATPSPRLTAAFSELHVASYGVRATAWLRSEDLVDTDWGVTARLSWSAPRSIL